MGRPKTQLTEEQKQIIEQAKGLRAEGKSWSEIGEALGVNKNWIRYRLDSVYHDSHYFRREDGMTYATRTPISEPELRRRLDLVPRVDTRDFTARFFGDPIPGDMRRCENN